MHFYSVTRLKIRSFRFLLPFFWHNFTSKRQIQKSEGFLGGKLLVDKNLTFWTLTIWKDRASTMHFRNSGAHLKAMPHLFHWCDEAAYGHWEEEKFQLLDWLEVHQKLIETGKLSKVKYPSETHLKREFKVPYPSKYLKSSLQPKK